MMTHYQREALNHFPGRLLTGGNGPFAIATSSAIWLFETQAEAEKWRAENAPGAAGWRLKPPPEPVRRSPALPRLDD